MCERVREREVEEERQRKRDREIGAQQRRKLVSAKPFSRKLSSKFKPTESSLTKIFKKVKIAAFER